MEHPAMFALFAGSAARERQAKLEALDKSQATIEFAPDGTILDANANFLAAMGYTRAEIVGKHHRIFVDPADAASPAYKEFWAGLAAGRFAQAEYRRIRKDGAEIWIQASYNPLIGADGKAYKVVKYASDVTARKLHDADFDGQIAAIRRSQAVIEFDLDGTILDANDNFLAAMGYPLSEIKGKHHSMFAEPGTAQSAEYREFWAALKRGEFGAGEFKRLAKGGREVWIQASYNPIRDMNGKPFKVVKYAADTTEQVQARLRAEKARAAIAENLGQVDRAISEANAESSATAAASEQTSTNVQAVAAGAEELDASVREIAQSMIKSKTESDGAFERVLAADQSTQRLVKAAEAMGGIVALIQGIAGQINLLALNATIESARAGDAGKGFAVVANEVKNLARQAADATDLISKEIDGIQSVTRDVVGGLGAIRKSLESVKEYVTSTASAVEEQSAVAREMSHNMQIAATSVETIVRDVGRIAQATQAADASTKQVREAAAAFA
jgi:methyl-accepting chemotaxis protein